MSAIRLEGLSKRFATKDVLRGVDMSIERGELVGFVGPNGAGKTTCLRILLGLLARDEGEARVLGMDPQSEALAIRQRCCYLPGETSLYAGMRGKEFLRFALHFYPDHQSALRERLEDSFQLPLDKKIRQYSAGMKQKLALIATLVPDVDLYLLDEPDRALDATTRFQLRDVLRDLSKQGKTILLSSHHLREVESIANRLVFLLDGTCIEPERIEAAREVLRARVRLRLAAGAEIPQGAEEIRRDPDGTRHFAPSGSPLEWLATFAPSDVESAEFGSVHLEDLYRVLTVKEAQRS